MEKKSLIISAAGLKNIIFSKNDEFIFIFGDKEIKMNRILADFISPRVNKLHRSDPTINSFCFDDIFHSILSDQNSAKIFQQMYNLKNIIHKEDSTDNEDDEDSNSLPNDNINSTNDNNKKVYSQLYANFFNDEIIDLLFQISNGHEIEIDEETSVKLRLLSMVIGNEELFLQINKLFPQKIDEASIDMYLLYLLNTKYYQSFPFFNENQVIEYISSHFYSIDRDDLMNLPLPILYSIISNDHLIIESEDSLYDFVTDLFENEDLNDESSSNDYDIISFYGLIEFSELSEEKFNDFLTTFNPSEITNSIWQKLNQCFYFNMKSSIKKKKEKSLTDSSARYFYTTQVSQFPYDQNPKNKFKGIIHYLTEKFKGNVSDKNIVNISSSSMYMASSCPKNAVDFDSIRYFASNNEEDAWILYDFKDRKVQPSHYTLRSRNDCRKGGNHLRKWCIEGSNDLRNWVTLDVRKKEKSLDDADASNTFEIQTDLGNKDYYRYLRLRQIGYNTGYNYHLNISALEYFGNIIEKTNQI